jgi:formylglycine-generating enzyme required for sulfatase activity
MAIVRVSRMTTFALFWACGAALGPKVGMAQEAMRVALVIGNGAYVQAAVPHAPSDARAIADALRDGGFEVIYLENARRSQIQGAIDAFGHKLERGVTAVVYLSGHAVQYQRRNFFLPLDAKITSPADVRRESIDIDSILDPLIVARPIASAVILDAGRPNPWQKVIADRVHGLATQEPIEGVEVVYPTEPGKVVAETGRTASLFSSELAKAMRIPGLPFEAVLRQTRAAIKRTGGDQEAWQSSAAAKDLIITPRPPANLGPADPLEVGYWSTIKNSETAADFQAYLESYPNGRFAMQARERLDQIAVKGIAKPAEPEGTRALSPTPAVVRDCEQCPELVLVSSGSFEMGSANNFAFERPVHHVTIAKPFYLGRREVTFDEWDACVAEAGCQYRPDDRGQGRGLRPVTDVDWEDAKVYVTWLSRKTGHTYRLPTESEWEYAARAGTTTAYPWGQGIDVDRANCAGCNPKPFNNAVDTGKFPPNAFGLLDMAGNAAEWVEDCWNESYRGAPTDGSAFVKPQCQERVLRGGSFNNDPRYLRSSARFKYDYDVRYYANGFRVLREK